MTYRASVSAIVSALESVAAGDYYARKEFGRFTLERTISPDIRAKGSRKFNVWGVGGATDPRNGAWHFNEMAIIVDYDWRTDVRLLDDVIHEDAVLIGHALREPGNWNQPTSGIVNLMLGDREEFPYELSSIEEDGRPVGRRLTVSFPLTYDPTPITWAADPVYIFTGDDIDGAKNGTLGSLDWVSDWRSASGKAFRHASQPTLSKRPAFHPDAVNGRPSLVWDGEDDELVLLDSKTDLGFLANTGKFTIVAVMRYDLPLLSYLFHAGVTERPEVFLQHDGDGSWTVKLLSESDTTQVFTGALHTLGTPGIIAARCDGSTLGVSGDLTSWSTASVVSLASGAEAANDYEIGSTVSTIESWDGAIPFLGIWDRQLSEAEFTTLASYLNARWAV